METVDGSAVGRPTAFDTIVLGGLAIGVLDFLDASIFFTQYFGISLARVWQGVAAGVLGREAATAGGWNTAALGILLHFVVAFVIATVFFIGTRVTTFLVNHPIVSGLSFGVIAHFVMQHVVIPLSAAGGPTPAPFRWPVFLNSVIGHALLVGLPVALIASWYGSSTNRLRKWTSGRWPSGDGVTARSQRTMPTASPSTSATRQNTEASSRSSDSPSWTRASSSGGSQPGGANER